jgi:MoaA/NifB/PqqE/SkfB family radical SAM enzyme
VHGVAQPFGFPSDEELPRLPLRLQVEVTNACHLGCSSCARHHWDVDANPIGVISPETLDRLQPLLHAARELTIGGYGDPTEAPDRLVETVRRGKANGCSVRLITGGSKLNGILLERLIEAGLDRLVLSMDGAQDSTLRDLRGVSLRAWLGWIRTTRELAVGARPLIQLNVVLQTANIEELPELVQLCADEGVAGIHGFHLKAYAPATFDRCLLADPEAARPWFEAARERAGRLGVFLKLPTLDPAPQVCTQPFEHLFVRHDGSVRGCCSGLFEPADFGLFAGRLQDGPEAAWRAPVLQRYRAAVRSGDDAALPVPCRSCAFRLPDLAAHRRPLQVVA